MKVITLKNGGLKTQIDPQGAWLASFTSQGEPILYPRTTFGLPDGSSKVRGGCHVCLPNFGPGGDSGLAQHGFGRDSAWTVVEVKSTEAKLSLRGADDYQGLLATLEYRMNPDSLKAELTVCNQGKAALRISPGFHPYFYCGAATVTVDGSVTDPQQFTDPQVMDAPPVIIETADHTLSVNAENLTTWITWTDNLGDYVCFEPTMKGFSFMHAVEEDELLKPSQSKTFSLNISLR